MTERGAHRTLTLHLMQHSTSPKRPGLWWGFRALFCCRGFSTDGSLFLCPPRESLLSGSLYSDRLLSVSGSFKAVRRSGGGFRSEPRSFVTGSSSSGIEIRAPKSQRPGSPLVIVPIPAPGYKARRPFGGSRAGSSRRFERTVRPRSERGGLQSSPGWPLERRRAQPLVQ